MSSTEKSLPLNWKKPDELLRLQRLKQKKKQLAARVSYNKNNNDTKTNIETDKAALLEAKIVQKRKNPFSKSAENAKKYKTDIRDDSEDSLLTGVNALTTTEKEAVIRETSTLRPPPAKLVLQPFDPKTFSQLLHKSTSAQTTTDDDDIDLDNQKITKHLPMDWSLKTRVRFFCRSELPSIQLKTSQLASGLTSFVRCINTQTEGKGLDISPATRFNQATYYWQHPHIPWMTLFPRNSRENTGIALGEKERNALSDDWNYSFKGLFQLLRARQCAYFYLCANTFTVLFRAAGVGGRAEMHAFMSPTTRGLRQSLRQEGIDFLMPLKNDKTYSQSSPNSKDNSQVDTHTNKKDNSYNADSEEEEEEEWLESLEVDVKEIRKIQTAHQRKLKVQEMSEDFSDNSLVLIEGAECQGFFSFLLNAKSTIGTIGRLAGVPPTLLAPVAFPKATMQHLNTRSNKVRYDGVDYYSIEVKGVILPSFLPYTCHLLGETKETFSATLASSVNTLAFSKATQKLLQNPKEPCSSNEQNVGDEAASQVFGQENLSDCGLGTCVIESMCQTGQQSIALLERICYDKEYGYAWS
uniref:Protein downstream neighbor of son homolog n=1 Tax=Glossina brevipalpis TaxID=37001 RepID=A0A1A9WTY4_9MUSC